MKGNIQLEATNTISLTQCHPSPEWFEIIEEIHSQIEKISQ